MKIDMKKIFLILTTVLTVAAVTAQVYTPNGSVVNVALPADSNHSPTNNSSEIEAIILAINSTFNTFHASDIYEEDISPLAYGSFNCHGFALYMEGSLDNTPKLINYSAPYFEDYSYIEISADSATIVLYGPDAHTAVKPSTNPKGINVPGLVMSKWSTFGFYHHTIAMCPWAYDPITYYKKNPAYINPANDSIRIEGYDEIITNVGDTISFSLYDDGIKTVSASWSVIGDIEIVGSNTGNTIIVKRTSPNSGSATLTATYGSIIAKRVYDLPKLTVTPGSISPGTQTIAHGSSVYLNHTGSSNVTSRLWWKSTDNGSSWSSTKSTGINYSETLTNYGSSDITVKYRVQVNGTNLYSSESVITVEPEPPPPPSPEIIGDDQLCTGSAQYYLDNAPSGTIYWKSSDTNLLSVSSSGGNTATATREGTDTGTVTLSAHLGHTGFGTELASISVTICSVPQPPSISGSSLICSSAGFSATNWQSGYYWESSSSLVNISSSSSSSTTVSVASSSSSGPVTLSVINSSGTTLATYDAWVGKPTLSASFTNSTEGWVGYPTEWMVMPYYSQSHSYTVEAYKGSTYANVTNVGSGHFDIYFPESGSYTIIAYTSNSCGSSSPLYQYNFPVYGFRMGFNPKSNEIEISIDDGNAGRSLASSNFTVTISDSSGVSRSQGNYLGSSFTVPASSLADGTYSVKISNGTINKTEQLLIKR